MSTFTMEEIKDKVSKSCKADPTIEEQMESHRLFVAELKDRLQGIDVDSLRTRNLCGDVHAIGELPVVITGNLVGGFNVLTCMYGNMGKVLFPYVSVKDTVERLVELSKAYDTPDTQTALIADMDSFQEEAAVLLHKAKVLAKRASGLANDHYVNIRKDKIGQVAEQIVKFQGGVGGMRGRVQDVHDESLSAGAALEDLRAKQNKGGNNVQAKE